MATEPTNQPLQHQAQVYYVWSPDSGPCYLRTWGMTGYDEEGLPRLFSNLFSAGPDYAARNT